MTKKIFAALAFAAMSLTASAQTQPNRLIVHDRSGAESYRLSSVDSLSFRNIEGDVRADVKFLNYATGNTGDTIWTAVTRTPACVSYNIDVLPSLRVNGYNDDNIIQYFKLQNNEKFYQDFTNAQLTGIPEMYAASDYTLFTVGYDELGTPCEVSRAKFTTPKPVLVGNPQVNVTVTANDYKSITFEMEPNKDARYFAICIFDKGTAEEQLIQWAPMFSFANMGQMIEQFSGGLYTKKTTKTINGLTPGTEYELYVQPIDANGNYADINVVPCATKSMGGDGESVMSIEFGEFRDEGNNEYSLLVTYTPNDQTGLHRDIIVDKKIFESSDNWNHGDLNKLKEYLQTPNDLDPYWDQFGVDEVRWTVNPGTTYIAATIGQNANGEWGELVTKEITTPAAAGVAAKVGALPARKVSAAPARVKGKFNGVAPAKTFGKIQLAQ